LSINKLLNIKNQAFSSSFKKKERRAMELKILGF